MFHITHYLNFLQRGLLENLLYEFSEHLGLGIFALLIEMLVHQKGDTVYLFRGILEKWQDASFKNIRLPGAFSISASQKNGKLESCRIKSLKGGTFKLSLNDCIHELSFQPNEEKAFS